MLLRFSFVLPGRVFFTYPFYNLMLSSKFWAATLLWSLLALPLAYSQAPTASISSPKWEFGLRGGVGFSMQHVFKEGRTTYVYPDGQLENTYYLGAYATRNFNQRWSLRTELSGITAVDTGPFRTKNNFSLSLGLYPRYRLNKWLSLETGVESNFRLGSEGKPSTNLWFGTVLHWKNVELNARFSPGYAPKNEFHSAYWQNTFQVGASVRLASVGKLFRAN